MQTMQYEDRGAYSTTINWENAQADKHYPVKVRVEKIAGITLGNRMEVTGDIRDPYSVSVNYQGGNGPTIGDFTMPMIWFYLIIGLILFTAGYSSIKVYNYLTIPPEVREIRGIIQNIQEGDMEYPRITREEQYEEKIDELIE